MTNEIWVYLAPVIFFTVGAFVIYFLKKYYLRRMTDYWTTDDARNRQHVEFNFHAGNAWAWLIIGAVVLSTALGVFSCEDQRLDHERGLERDALEQYKEEIRDDVKRDIIRELNPDE